jgi:putative aldouronate transport system substrate-binding protein
MFKRKAICLIMIFTILISAATGCKKSENKETSGGSTSTGENKPTKFSYFTFSSDGTPSWDGPIHKKVTEKTGVSMEIEYMVGADVNEKVGVMIAGREYADFIDARGLGVPEKLIEAGALIPLDELIEKHAPNIKKLWGDSLKKLKNSKDGKVYLLDQPMNKPAEIVDANQSLLIQYDVLDKMNYPTPKTLDDVFKLLKDYTAKYPEINGKPFIPWGLWADTWGYNITVNNPAQWTNGFVDNSDAYVDPKTYQVKYFNSTDYFKDYLKWMNKLYTNGMLDKNGFITKNDQWKSLISTGRVLATIDGTWDVADGEAALRKAGMPERAYARFPIVMKEGIKDRSQVYCESYSWGLGISKNCKDPVRAIKFLDYMCSEEGTILQNWGIEGVHYDVVSGKRVMKPEVNKALREDSQYKYKQGFGLVTGRYNTPVKLSDGQYAVPFNPEDTYKNSDEWTRKVMDKYKIKYWGQMFDVSGERTPYGFAWNVTLDPKSPGSLASSKADELRHAFVPQIVMSKNDSEFDKNWQDFTKKLADEANISKWEKEMTDGIAKRLEVFGVK